MEKIFDLYKFKTFENYIISFAIYELANDDKQLFIKKKFTKYHNDEQYILINEFFKLVYSMAENNNKKTEVFLSLCDDKTKTLEIISLNVFNSEKTTQVNMLNKYQPDILFLQECSQQAPQLFPSYDSYGMIESHSGFVHLLIHTALRSKLVFSHEEKGILLHLVNTVYGLILLGSLHLEPHKTGNFIRAKQLRTIIQFIKNYQLEACPVIIAGDTNMRDDENWIIDESNTISDAYDTYTQDYSLKERIKIYPTFPNRAVMKQFNSKYNFRFDRCFIRNSIPLDFQVINTFDSDHLMLYIELEI
jgi:endonuclease/exonuclease/phosphatase family metal-dependent hydrolase